MNEMKSIPFARPWITDDDRHAVLEVLEGHILTHGPQCKGFEEEFGSFLGVEAHCVTVSSCMAALHLAYFHFGIGSGDEVIVPAMTHTATVHAVELVGAKPIFVDCEPATGNIDVSLIERAVTPRTRAIGLVHFLGIPCSMPDILEIAARHGLKIIEDCALSVGARYGGKHTGLFGDAGCFSFYPIKHITTGEGGMFVSRYKDIAESVSRQRAFGVDRSHSTSKTPGIYDVIELGLNYRMSEMQAALGRKQVLRLNEILERRKKNFLRLKEMILGIPEIVILDTADPEATNSHYCLSIVLKGRLAIRRAEIVEELNAQGVGTSIYYPQPVPRMTYYRNKYGYDASVYPNAEAISDCSIALPVGPHLAVQDVEYIGETVVKTLKKVIS